MTSVLIGIAGFVIAVVGVIFGGSLFLSIPLMQIIFPGISFGSVIGNIKTGSFFRGLGSTLSTVKKIELKENLPLIVTLVLGTIAGSTIISRLDQKWVLPALLIAIILSEFNKKIAKHITKKIYYLAVIMTGVYTGFLGAGSSLLIIALLRFKHKKDEKIGHITIQARFVEWIASFFAVSTHLINGDLIAAIWIPWSIGSILGGIVGGVMLKKIGKMPGKIQKSFLRTAFAIAIIISIIKLFS